MTDKREILLEDTNILIVDDTPQNIDILVEALGDIYSLQVATNGLEALEAVEDYIPDLILLDIMMPEMNGFEVCRKLKSEDRTRDVPVIFLTAMDEIGKKQEGFRLGAVDYITKPFDIIEVAARVNTHLSVKMARDILKNQNELLEVMVQKRTREITATQDVTIRMAASLAETRDPETGNHIIRTQRYVQVLADAMKEHPDYSDNLTSNSIHLIVKSAPLHDLGKIGIPDSVLLKPGKLTDQEFDVMKQHCRNGYDAMGRAESEMEEDMRQESFLRYAREIALTHHEKWDGSGYPQGQSGEDIPLPGRLMAIADVYDALISKRPYKEPFPHKKACSIIEQGRGTHFDPILVDFFITLEDRFEKIARDFTDTDFWN